MECSEDIYRAVLQASIMGFWLVDLDGNIVDVNRAYCELTGYSREELLTMRIQDLDAEEKAEETKSHIRLIMDRGYDRFETLHRCKDGRIIHVEINTSFLDMSEERLIVFITDITDKKLAEAKLQEAVKALERSNMELEQFAYLASHDLQEPLRKITSFGERLLTHYRGALDEKGQDYLDRMVRAGGRMSQLIEGILRLSRVATQSQPDETVNLNEIVTDAISDLELRITESEAAIEVGPLPEVRGSRIEMRQLFQNLIANSLKFRRQDEPPRIKLTLRGMTAGFAEISFCDNGTGFEEKYSDRIFKPFQRLQPDRFDGIGIGLTICHKIITRRGGAITAKGTPGSGATFIFTLPVYESREVSNDM